jgi:ankyrin repeat protein
VKVQSVILSVVVTVITCSQVLLKGVEEQSVLDVYREMPTHAIDLISRTKQSSDYLIQHDLEVAKNRKWNDLHLAVLWGLEQEVTRLIEVENYLVNACDSIESTPLHLAVARGNTACAQILLEKGAKVDAQDKYGWTPLHAALFYLPSIHHPCVKLLEEYRASITIKNLQGDTPWDLRKSDRCWR